MIPHPTCPSLMRVRLGGRCRHQHRTLALPAACGLDVMLVVDSSGSIASAGAEQAVRNALNAFIGALNDTGSELGLIDFDTLATVLSPSSH